MTGTLKQRPDFHKPMAKQLWGAALVFLLVLSSPAQGFEQPAGNDSRMDVVTIPYQTDLPGFGLNFLSGEAFIYFISDRVVFDSDPVNGTNFASVDVSIYAAWPGTDLFTASSPPTATLQDTTCESSTVLFGNQIEIGTAAAYRSHVERFTWSDETNPDGCTAYYRVSSASDDIPVNIGYTFVFKNDDPEEVGLEHVAGVSSLDIAALVAWVLVGIMLWSRSKDDIVQIFGGLNVIVAGVVMLSMFDRWVFWVPIGATMAVLGSYLIIRSAIESTTDG